jgi:hypothetical protein
MKVLFKHLWFGPTEPKNSGKINETAGKRYRPGVHYVPAELKSLLPKTAVVIEDDTPVPEPVKAEPGETLRSFDELRAASEAQAQAEEKAEAERLRQRAEQMKRELEGDSKAKKKG